MSKKRRSIEKIVAKRKKRLTFDPSGFFTIMIDHNKGNIVVEYYKNVSKEETGREVDTGILEKVIVGKDAEEICHTIIREKMVSRLDHAAYIGRELQKAEIALRKDLEYEQDKDMY